MRKIFFVALLTLTGLFNSAFTQGIAALEKGDQVPDVLLDSIFNYTKTSAKLSDFKDKVIVLDFWTTRCGPCIRAFPKMDSLQRAFNKDVIIIAVTPERKEIVESFFKDRPQFKDFSLPVVYGDTNLKALFQPQYVPWEVIIKDNRVVAVTDAQEINAELLTKVVNGLPVSIYQIKRAPKEKRKYFNNEALFIDSESSAHLIQQKLFTRYVQGYPRTTERQVWATKQRARKYEEATRLYGQNMSRLGMIHSAWTPESGVDYRRIRFNVKDSTIYDMTYFGFVGGEAEEEWQRKNWYCYDYIVPPNSKQNVYDVFKKDIESLFNINVTYQKELTDCLVLTALDSTKFATKFEMPFIDWSQSSKDWTLKRASIYSFLFLFTQGLFPKKLGLDYPFVDETNYKGFVDINLRDMKSYESVRADLRRQGFDLLKQKREVMILRISDR